MAANNDNGNQDMGIVVDFDRDAEPQLPTAGPNLANGPFAVQPAVQPPVAAEDEQEEDRPIFGPYVRLGRTFDLDQLADGLQERNRTFAQPAGDDVTLVSDNAEACLQRVREALSTNPTNPSPEETRMLEHFTDRVQDIADVDVLLTQLSAEIVRSIIRLHEPSESGVEWMDGFVQDAAGNVVRGRVAIDPEDEVVGDHLRDDQIEELAPDVRDFRLTAAQRLDKICQVLRQTKAVAEGVFSGRDYIALLVGMPFRVQQFVYARGG